MNASRQPGKTRNRAAIPLWLTAVVILASGLLIACGGATSNNKGTPVEGPRRLAPLDYCRAVAKNSSWCNELREIPSTVIDKGVMRNVPYTSFATGDYELNVYGDPERPCCVEIGVRNELLTSLPAKHECVRYIMSILTDSADHSLLAALDLKQDLQKRNGLTFVECGRSEVGTTCSQ